MLYTGYCTLSFQGHTLVCGWLGHKWAQVYIQRIVFAHMSPCWLCVCHRVRQDQPHKHAVHLHSGRITTSTLAIYVYQQSFVATWPECATVAVTRDDMYLIPWTVQCSLCILLPDQSRSCLNAFNACSTLTYACLAYPNTIESMLHYSGLIVDTLPPSPSALVFKVLTLCLWNFTVYPAHYCNVSSVYHTLQWRNMYAGEMTANFQLCS